jgi:hypothetical protein
LAPERVAGAFSKDFANFNPASRLARFATCPKSSSRSMNMDLLRHRIRER